VVLSPLTQNLMGVGGLHAHTRAMPTVRRFLPDLGPGSPPSWGRIFGVQRTNEGETAKWTLKRENAA